MTKKVLLFADVGIDDTIALIYAYLKKEVEIVGVVADYGNASRNDTVRNVNYLFRLFNFPPQVRVFSGAAVPLTGEPPKYFPDIHGQYGLGPLVPTVSPNQENIIENFHEIIDLINRYQGELTIVNTGRLTSLATMFILYSNVMRKVKDYYIMGGAFWVPGNVTAVAEANIHDDPIAANLVLTYAENVTIIPLNVTEKAVVTPEMVNYIHSKGRTLILKPLLDSYYEAYKKKNPAVAGSPVHDALTLMAVAHNEMFTFYSLPVQIVQFDPIARGQSIGDIRPNQSIEPSIKRHRIAMHLNESLFYKEFMTIMTGENFY